MCFMGRALRRIFKDLVSSQEWQRTFFLLKNLVMLLLNHLSDVLLIENCLLVATFYPISTPD